MKKNLFSILLIIALLCGLCTTVYANSETGTITNAKITNGTLTWDKYEGAVNYVIIINNGDYASYPSSSLTHPIDSDIDELVKYSQYPASGSVTITIFALSSSNTLIAECTLTYSYTSTATPVAIGEIKDVKVTSDGKLAWSAYDGAYLYEVYLNDDSYYWDRTSGTSIDGLNETIDDMVRYKEIPQSGSLKIQIVAVNSHYFTIAKCVFNYQYTSSVTPIGTIQNAKISSGGILTWDSFEGSYGYTLYIDSCTRDFVYATDVLSYNLNEEIDYMIENDLTTDNGSHELYLIAYDPDQNGLATWSTTYKYFKNPCAITFNSNGGSGNMAAETVGKGTQYTLPACAFTAPAGKEFDTWDKGAPGTDLTINTDIVITAIWKDKPAGTTTESDPGTDSSPGQEQQQPPADQSSQQQEQEQTQQQENPPASQQQPPQEEQPQTEAQPGQQEQQEQQSDERIVFSKLKKVKVKAVSKKKIKVSWKKLSKKVRKEVKKIQIQVSTDQNFQNIVKTKLVSSKKTSCTISGLKKKTKYFIRIRAYTEKDGVRYVSEWVKKSKKTKKK